MGKLVCVILYGLKILLRIWTTASNVLRVVAGGCEPEGPKLLSAQPLQEK